MALKATIYKIHLNIADMDRDYYCNHNMTLACHPSETENRLMVRILTFAQFATENLAFTRGLSEDEEPDIWEKNMVGEVTHWIELGVPAEDRVRKACHKSALTTVVAYGQHTAEVWWEKHKNKFQKFNNLQVFFLPDDQLQAMASKCHRNMDFQVSIQGGEMWVAAEGETTDVCFQQWKETR